MIKRFLQGFGFTFAFFASASVAVAPIFLLAYVDPTPWIVGMGVMLWVCVLVGVIAVFSGDPPRHWYGSAGRIEPPPNPAARPTHGVRKGSVSPAKPTKMPKSYDPIDDEVKPLFE